MNSWMNRHHSNWCAPADHPGARTCWPSRCGYLHLVFPMNFKQNKSICRVLIWILHCKIYGYYLTSCFVYNIATNLGAVQVSGNRSMGVGGYPKCSLLLTRGEGGEGYSKWSLDQDHALGGRGKEPKWSLDHSPDFGLKQQKGLTCIYHVLFWTAICSFVIINILYDN